MPTQQAYVGNNVQLILGSGNDISGQGNKISFDIKQNVIDITTFGNTWRRVMAGLSEFTFKYDFVWAYGGTVNFEAILFGLFGYLNQTVAFTLSFLRTTGSPVYTGNAILSDYTRSTDVKTAIVGSCTFEGDNAPLVGVHA